MFLPTRLAAQSKDDRLRLIGKGDHLLDLVLRHSPPSYQWAQWLRLPLASAASDGDATTVEELLEAGADGKAGPRGPVGDTLVNPRTFRGGSGRPRGRYNRYKTWFNSILLTNPTRNCRRRGSSWWWIKQHGRIRKLAAVVASAVLPPPPTLCFSVRVL